jgi:hypothetical protein
VSVGTRLFCTTIFTSFRLSYTRSLKDHVEHVSPTGKLEFNPVSSFSFLSQRTLLLAPWLPLTVKGVALTDLLVLSNSSVRVSQRPNDYNFVIPGAILMDGLLHSFCLGFVLALGLKYWEEYTEDSIRKRAFVLTVVFLSLYVPPLIPATCLTWTI